MSTRLIHITEEDLRRLHHLLGAVGRQPGHDQDHRETLRQEIDRAVVLNAADLPEDVVTMRTRVRVRDLESGQLADYTVVYPWEADIQSNRISVLAPLGTALLGYREGDDIEWPIPKGLRRLRVERILRQPEAARRRDSPLPPGSAPSAATHAAGAHAGSAPSGDSLLHYDELDRRLMDTFPASDAVARYI